MVETWRPVLFDAREAETLTRRPILSDAHEAKMLSAFSWIQCDDVMIDLGCQLGYIWDHLKLKLLGRSLSFLI